MKLRDLFLMAFAAILIIPACTKDDDMGPDEPMGPTDCQLISVNSRIDETTSFGLFDIDYNEDGSLASAGLQTYDFTYNADGQLVEALLEGSNLNPQVQYIFTYNGDLILSIQENWGEEPNVEERYVFTPTYDSEGFVDEMMRTGLGGDVTLDYDFDSDGNALIWSDPTFQDRREFTFSGEKGLIEGLDHTLAFAYGIAISQPFFHFQNQVISETTFGSDGTQLSSDTFTELSSNQLGFQTEAGTASGAWYLFEYACE